MIEVDRLTRRFADTLALDGISFRVESGEVVGFLGPNGAGKSTAMRILTGSLAPSAGTARLAGFDIQDDSLEVRRRVGFMPEQVPLYPDSSVHGLLRFVADLKGVAPDQRENHLARIEERTGLSEVRRRQVGHLSKGYRQRVGLAQALVGDPPILILDEPSSGLDPHQIVEIRELIRSFRGEKTVLLSSHILGEVDKICARVLILNRGRLVAEQRPEELHSRAQDSLRVVLAWEGERAAVLAALKQLAGVTAVVPSDDGAEVVVEGRPEEIRPSLVEAVRAAGGRLQHLKDRVPSLEDLFLSLTADPADASDTATDPAEDPR